MSRGTFLCYVPKKFGREAMDVIEGANRIIDEYEGQGLTLTLRQVYYQFVARGWMPNKQSEYDRLGRILSEARMAGLVSWTAMEDRTRNLKGHRTYDSPGQAVAELAREYKVDLWANQRFRPEVWVEKEALEGVIAGICSQLRVDFFAVRGYNSQSEQWRAGQRFRRYVERGQVPVVLHLGDHDPSGIDMTRDNRERLSLFAGVQITVVRLALTMDQVREVRPPPNPAKVTDARFLSYREEYGTDQSWELDALPPTYVRDLIDREVQRLRDPDRWDEAVDEEVGDIRLLQDASEEMNT